MNWRSIRAVMKKDLMVVTRSKMVLLPMILLPLIMQVLMPIGFGVGAYFMGNSADVNMQDIEQMMAMMPPSVSGRFADSPGMLFFQMITVYGFAPMFLIVPMMVASVIAADSFVGERERKTLEALLYTPITNMEMLVAKMLSAWVAALVVGVLSFVLYGVVVDGFSLWMAQTLLLPNWLWIVLVFWVGPAVAGLSLGVMVLISSRVKTYQEAYQMGGIVVLPLVILMLGQFTGLFYFSPLLAVVIGAGIWLIDAVLVWFGVKSFDRDALLARL